MFVCVGWLAAACAAKTNQPPDVPMHAQPAAPRPKAAPVPPPAPVALPQLPGSELDALRSRAPQLARDVERVYAAAQRSALDGDAVEARELAAIADHLMYAANAALAGQTSGLAEAEDADETRAKVARRKPRDPKTDDPIAYPMIGAPPVVADETLPVRQRLSELANELARVRTEIPADKKVALEGVQSTLIEADRALGEGLIRRAEELASQAELLLRGLEGKPAPAPEPVVEPEVAAEQGKGFLADARDTLGKRAIVRGGVVAVRLDSLVHFREAEWTIPPSSPLDGVRSLVRSYREVGLGVVTVGSPSQGEFSKHKTELLEQLSVHFRISPGRVSWLASTDLRLEPGTYLILDHGATES